jgi:hypothetical protein
MLTMPLQLKALRQGTIHRAPFSSRSPAAFRHEQTVSGLVRYIVLSPSRSRTGG